ncbi:GPP34 family phosphoprotein [Streptomyces sp. NBC_00237]|uniref:GOLPH3/VPS74 family protein n=1 Tax=Streptomyces sp. NBC_00237 TaxID=2975687 RepID=UPI0022589B6C|nr:GPP34 family phosphoprotein [Streptomyces sp. NBC_00237]MCX5205392.1 GPP34 family phosphoprotein [Streptomyces sp. NBC_00237]
MTMGDELFLLAVGTGRRHPRIRSDNRLRIALRAAELAELCLVGRIALGVRHIEILDSGPVEDRRLNNVLRDLARTAPPPSFHDWLRLTPQSVVTEYFSRLDDQKVLRSRRRRDPAGYTRHEVVSVDAARRQGVLDRLDAVARSGPGTPPADPRDLALAVLVGVADIAPAVYPGVRGSSARRRLAALTTSEGTALLASAQAVAPRAGGSAGLPSAVQSVMPGRQLAKQLTKLYSDVTTGDSGLAHGLDSGGWSGGGSDGGND